MILRRYNAYNIKSRKPFKTFFCIIKIKYKYYTQYHVKIKNYNIAASVDSIMYTRMKN